MGVKKTDDLVNKQLKVDYDSEFPEVNFSESFGDNYAATNVLFKITAIRDGIVRGTFQGTLEKIKDSEDDKSVTKKIKGEFAAKMEIE